MTVLLVTGGCGFIGANFLHYWRRHHPNDELRNLDALTYAANPSNVASFAADPNYEFIHADIADPKAVHAGMNGVDYVIHFAAESHVDRSIGDAGPFVRTNVVGTQILLDAARRADVRRFHHVSTDEVFGELPLEKAAVFREDSPYRPRSPYAASKAASDHLVRAWGATYGLAWSLTHGTNNYGPYQHPEKAIPRFVTNLILGQKIPVYGDGRNVRDWLHVEDYCEAIALVVEKGAAASTFCVGGGNETANLALARAVAKHFGRSDDAVEFVRDRPGHDLRYALDASKIRQELGWRPRHDFSQGLKATIDWYRENEAWWRPLRERMEGVVA